MGDVHVYLPRRKRAKDCACKHRDQGLGPTGMGSFRVELEAANGARRLSMQVASSRENAMQMAQLQNPGWKATSAKLIFAGSPGDQQNLRPERVAASQRALAEMEPEAASRAVAKARATGRTYPTSGQRERSEGDQGSEGLETLQRQWNALMNQRTAEKDPSRKADLMKQIVALEGKMSSMRRGTNAGDLRGPNMVVGGPHKDQVGHELGSWLRRKLMGQDQSSIEELKEALLAFLEEEEEEEEHEESEDQETASYGSRLEEYRRSGGGFEAAQGLKPHVKLTPDQPPGQPRWGPGGKSISGYGISQAEWEKQNQKPGGRGTDPRATPYSRGEDYKKKVGDQPGFWRPGYPGIVRENRDQPSIKTYVKANWPHDQMPAERYNQLKRLQQQIEDLHKQQVEAAREGGVQGIARFQRLGQERTRLEAEYQEALRS